MYGRYTKDLGEYAKDEARKLKILERRRKQEDKARNKVSECLNTLFCHLKFAVVAFFSKIKYVECFVVFICV